MSDFSTEYHLLEQGAIVDKDTNRDVEKTLPVYVVDEDNSIKIPPKKLVNSGDIIFGGFGETARQLRGMG